MPGPGLGIEDTEVGSGDQDSALSSFHCGGCWVATGAGREGVCNGQEPRLCSVHGLHTQSQGWVVHGAQARLATEQAHDTPYHGPTMRISITSPTKVRLTKAMVFPVVMYRCES